MGIEAFGISQQPACFVGDAGLAEILELVKLASPRIGIAVDQQRIQNSSGAVGFVAGGDDRARKARQQSGSVFEVGGGGFTDLLDRGSARRSGQSGVRSDSARPSKSGSPRRFSLRRARRSQHAAVKAWI
ncbi:MAG: hypothetical protein ACKVK6_11385, partial [bacterium]